MCEKYVTEIEGIFLFNPPNRRTEPRLWTTSEEVRLLQNVAGEIYNGERQTPIAKDFAKQFDIVSSQEFGDIWNRYESSLMR